jgi:hypothetical protein
MTLCIDDEGLNERQMRGRLLDSGVEMSIEPPGVIRANGFGDYQLFSSPR